MSVTQPLDYANGSVVFGTLDSPRNPYTSAVTGKAMIAGQTYRTPALEVPHGARFVSFEIRGTPTGTGSLSVKVRSGNRSTAPETDVLVDWVTLAPTPLTAISAPGSDVISVDADANFVQLEISPSGCDFSVTAIATARQV